MLKDEERYAHVTDLSAIEREFCGPDGSWEEMRTLVLSMKKRMEVMETYLCNLVNGMITHEVLPPP